jgi:hypothetical protein
MSGMATGWEGSHARRLVAKAIYTVPSSPYSRPRAPKYKCLRARQRKAGFDPQGLVLQFLQRWRNTSGVCGLDPRNQCLPVIEAG